MVKSNMPIVDREVIRLIEQAVAAERERCAAEIEQLKDELHAAKAALGAEGRANLERYMAAKRAAIRKGERLIWTEDGCYGCNPVCDGCDGCGTRLRPGYRWSIG